MALSTTSDLIADIRAGRMIILMDDPGRENEGDLVISASGVTAEHINFMAHHGCGLICLTLHKDACERLSLPLMAESGFSWHGTNFTVSIDAAAGVTTGISAADRAHTIRVAADPASQARNLARPGHVFPLMAHPGGVLFRAGHTEAGCDLTRLAGHPAAAVIVEILNKDGSMARRPQLEQFADEHGLRIGTISDLIEFRLQHEQMIRRIREETVETRYGRFRLVCYRDEVNDDDHFAFVSGAVSKTQPTLVRVHRHQPLLDSVSLLADGADLLIESAGRRDLASVLRRIGSEGGVVVVLCGVHTSSDRLSPQTDQPVPTGADQVAPDRADPAADRQDLRTIGSGSQILRDLGVRRMRVIGQPKRLHALTGFGLEVVDYIE